MRNLICSYTTAKTQPTWISIHNFFFSFSVIYLFSSWIITSDIHGVLHMLSMALFQLALAIFSLFFFFFRYSIFLFYTFLGLISMIFFGYDTLALVQMVEFRDGI